MLSFIYNLVNNFESSHGIRPNLLYLNHGHLRHLADSFAEEYDLFQIMNMLQMEIIVDNEAMHPHVAWTRIMHTKTAMC